MIDIKCHMLSIKLKRIQKFFDSNYVSTWKCIEKRKFILLYTTLKSKNEQYAY